MTNVGTEKKTETANRLRTAEPGDDLTNLDLRGADLQDVNLAARDLSGSDFSGADLSEALLSGAILIDCTFRGATLDGANLVGAKLSRSDFTECVAKRAIFGRCDLVGAVFFSADLTGASLSGVDATGADFRTARLDEARLLDSDLTGADFSRSCLGGADLAGATVGDAVFRDADLSGALLGGLRNYEKANWINAAISSTDFSGAYLVRRTIMDQNYLHEFRNTDRVHEVLYQIWRFTSDCGRSITRWGFVTAVVASLFAILYTQVAIDYGDHHTILSPLYFSIVTITTLGYGDALPASLAAQVLVLIEVVIGYVMLGGVLSIFATRMGRRAD